MAKNKRKLNLAKEIYLACMGFVLFVFSKIFNIDTAQVATKAELERLKGTASIVYSETVNKHNELMNIFSWFGILLVFIAVVLIVIKIINRRKK